jgi:hypothetical protein
MCTSKLSLWQIHSTNISIASCITRAHKAQAAGWTGTLAGSSICRENHLAQTFANGSRSNVMISVPYPPAKEAVSQSWKSPESHAERKGSICFSTA